MSRRDPLVPTDANPEVKRLRLMSFQTRRDPRHRKETPAITKDRLLRIVIIVGILLGAIAALVLVAVYEPAKPERPTPTVSPTAPATRPPALGTPTSTSKVTTKPSVARVQPIASSEDTAIAIARELKPLENLDEGDRVLYQDRVCTWQKWGKRMTTSTIECAGLTFTTDTMRLIPAERR